MAIVRERLHQLVEELGDEEVPVAERYLEELKAAKQDPVRRALLTAAVDDEPETEEERAAIAAGAGSARARGDRLDRGVAPRVRLVTWEEVAWAEPARKDLRRLDPQVQERVVRAVLRCAETGQGNVKKPEGHPSQWRLRVGDWRVRFAYDDAEPVLRVVRVLPRGRAYRD